MKEKRTGKKSVREQKTNWEQLRSLDDAEIRTGIKKDPDSPETNADFWRQAKVVMPRRKETITIRLDSDLLRWLRQQKGYQTRINAVLRTYMDAQNPWMPD